MTIGRGAIVAADVVVKTKLIEQEIDAIRKYWRERNVGTHIRPMENRARGSIQGKN